MHIKSVVIHTGDDRGEEFIPDGIQHAHPVFPFCYLASVTGFEPLVRLDGRQSTHMQVAFELLFRLFSPLLVFKRSDTNKEYFSLKY